MKRYLLVVMLVLCAHTAFAAGAFLTKDYPKRLQDADAALGLNLLKTLPPMKDNGKAVSVEVDRAMFTAKHNKKNEVQNVGVMVGSNTNEDSNKTALIATAYFYILIKANRPSLTKTQVASAFEKIEKIPNGQDIVMHGCRYKLIMSLIAKNVIVTALFIDPE